MDNFQTGRPDALYLFLVWASIFFFILIVIGMIAFIVRFSRTQKSSPSSPNSRNGIFVAIPIATLLGIFAWGCFITRDMMKSPVGAYEIHVLAREQGTWQFQYDDGRTTTDEVFVPLDRPVKFIMTSKDVVHSFFVPNFRLKVDVIPGMYTATWFEPTIPGSHQILCAESCGQSHALMQGRVNVLDAEQWKAWIAGKKLGPIPDASDLAENPGLRAQIIAGAERRPL